MIASKPQDALFKLFTKWLDQGANFSKVSDIDTNVSMAKSSIYLKHDVHDMCLEALIAFASKQADMGIVGSYFFMPNGHPRTAKSYSFNDQVTAIKQVQSLGHEVGVHVDPYFVMVLYGMNLKGAIETVIKDFGDNDIDVKIGNMHGNSRYNFPDVNGYGTSFELFDEISRHSDFPKLSHLDFESAELIRRNRVSLTDFGITYWADMPIWSKKLGFVVTNFLTDNRFGKEGTFEFVTSADTCGAYLVCERQPPGSRNRSSGKQVFCHDLTCRETFGFPPENGQYNFLSDQFVDHFSSPCLLNPLLFLIHPEFYQ